MSGVRQNHLLRSTYDIFNNTGTASLLDERSSIEELSTILLEVLLWVSLSDTEALELSDNANLHGFVLDDDVAWCSIGLRSRSTLDDGSSFRLCSVRDPSLDDDVT